MPVNDEDDLPSTLQRSSKKAQDTYAATLNAAEEQYGRGERAGRTAFASLKHSFEKVGDHWEEKAEKGPSDKQAAKGGAAARRGGKTAGGVDVEGHTKDELLDRAREADVPGRSSMTKEELGEALDKENQKATRRARERERD